MVCLIVTGGEAPDKKLLNRYLKDAGLVIGVDGAADFFYRLDIKPDILIGDFDTADPCCVSALEE
jgi:thiamine pyrophosphokinase